MNEKEIQKLHQDAVVCLSYVNPWIEYRRTRSVSARRYFTDSEWWMEASVPMLRQGGVDLVVLSHGIPDRERFDGAAGVECLFKCYDALLNEIGRNRDISRLILTRRDLDDAIRNGKMGIILGVTAAPFNGDLATLRTLWRIGVRTVHPFGNDPVVGGFAGGSARQGLKPFGRQVIREMERLGMLVDLAHSNDRTFAEALRFAEKPLINSHTSCRAIADYDRCCTDDQLRALGEAGGVVGAHFGFVEKQVHVENAAHQKMLRGFDRKMKELVRKYKDPYEFLEHRMDPFEWPIALGGAVDTGMPIRRAKLSQLGDHIARMATVAGIDHVCMGSDYSCGAMPEGVETAETLVNLTRELVRRGFSAAAIKKIWGGNFIRLLHATLPAA